MVIFDQKTEDNAGIVGGNDWFPFKNEWGGEKRERVGVLGAMSRAKPFFRVAQSHAVLWFNAILSDSAK